MEFKNTGYRQKVTTDCGPVMLTPVVRLFQNKLMFLLKIMPIYDKPLLSGQTPLNDHLPVPRGWPVNGGSSVII